jgi:cystathionine gamma-synthase
MHRSIVQFGNAVLKEHGTAGESVLLFPSARVAQKFKSSLLKFCPELDRDSISIIELDSPFNSNLVSARVWPCLFPEQVYQVAKLFWQHSGDGISSRRAEYCYSLFRAGLLSKQPADGCKGPKRYQKAPKENGHREVKPDIELDGHHTYVEERYGRNLSISLASNAKLAIKRRIAGLLTEDVELADALRASNDQSQSRGFSEDDVYLYPAGMSAIFNTHQCLMAARPGTKSVCYGWVLRTPFDSLTSQGFRTSTH